MSIELIMLVAMVMLNSLAVILSIFYKGSDKRDSEIRKMNKAIFKNEKNYLIQHRELIKIIGKCKTRIKLLEQKDKLIK